MGANYPLKKLGDVADFVRGITFKPDDVIDIDTANSVACMRTKNVQSDLDLSDVWAVPASFVKRDEQYLRKGDILVSSANSWNLVGKCSWVPQLPYRATIGGFISCLRKTSQNLDERYLFHWFSSEPVQDLVRNCARKTTNISNLSFDQCLALEIPLPPLEEQKRIAAILDQADDICRKRQHAIDRLKQLGQAIFHGMFGDPENQAARSIELSELLTFVTSGGRGWSQYYADTGVRFIRSLDVQMNSIASDDAVYVDAPNNAEARRTAVQEGDVLLTITGSKIGRVAPVPLNFGPAFVSQHVAIMRLDQNRILPEFLSYYLSLPRGGQMQIARNQYGQTKPGINFEQIGRFSVPEASLDRQREFVSAIRQIEAISYQSEAATRLNDSLFASLQHRAFRGEL